ncbi:MAG TPA: CvpA family protein, partial [Ramlibacter sp.]|nr:CvpA family protein [Ramlibacter sp.]
MTYDINLVDALLALVILLSVVVGWYRGFLLGTLGLAVLIATVLLAFWGYPYVARELEAWDLIRGPLGLPIAFLGTFVIARILLGGLADLLVLALPAKAHTHVVNRLLGIVPGAVNGLINAMVVAVLLLALPLSDRLTGQTRGSEIAARLSEPAHALEARLTPIFEEAVSKTMSRVVVKPGSRESMPLAFTVQDPQPRPDLEAQMLQMLNRERAAHGLSPLRADPELTEVARAHSRDM